MDNRAIADKLKKSRKPTIELTPDEAMRALEEVGPRVYRLGGLQSTEKFCFYTLGCQGDEGYAQGTVAELMNQMAADPNFTPDFILILGDNFYPNGVKSVDDLLFYYGFYHLYTKEQLDRLRKVPFFVIEGNHDGKRHKPEQKKQEYIPGYAYMATPPEILEKYQAGHSYLTQPFDPYIPDKKAFYLSNVLNLLQAPKWNMPYVYYSLIANDTQIFCMNSNTLADEYLKYKKYGYFVKEPNQYKWFLEEYQKAIEAGRKVIIAQHHPLFTSSKRAYSGDADLYLDTRTDEIQTLNKIVFSKEIAGLEKMRAKLNARSLNASISFEDLNEINKLLVDASEIAKDTFRKVIYHKKETQPDGSVVKTPARKTNYEVTQLINDLIDEFKKTKNYNKELERIYDDAKACVRKNIEENLKKPNHYPPELLPKIKETLSKELTFDVINAHDHNINVYNNGKYCQITSGGGGAKGLHDKKNFAEFDKTCCFMKKNGFVCIVSHTNKPELKINIYSIADYELWEANVEEPKKGRLYVSISGSNLEYTVITPTGATVTDTISNKELKHAIGPHTTKAELEKLLPEILKITTAKGHTKIESDHLKLTSKQMRPCRGPSSDPRVDLIYNIVMSKWRKYHAWLNKKQNRSSKGGFLFDEKTLDGKWTNFKNTLNPNIAKENKNSTHSLQDAERIHSIINYLNKPETDDFNTMVKKISRLMHEMRNQQTTNTITSWMKQELEEKKKKKTHSIYYWIESAIKREPLLGNRFISEIYHDITKIEKMRADLLRVCDENTENHKRHPYLLSSDVTFKTDLVEYLHSLNGENNFSVFIRQINAFKDGLSKTNSLYSQIENVVHPPPESLVSTVTTSVKRMFGY